MSDRSGELGHHLHVCLGSASPVSRDSANRPRLPVGSLRLVSACCSQKPKLFQQAANLRHEIHPLVFIRGGVREKSFDLKGLKNIFSHLMTSLKFPSLEITSGFMQQRYFFHAKLVPFFYFHRTNGALNYGTLETKTQPTNQRNTRPSGRRRQQMKDIQSGRKEADGKPDGRSFLSPQHAGTSGLDSLCMQG